MSWPRVMAIGLLALWSLLILASLTNWNSQVRFGNQGRLLFPAISSLAVLMALGLTTLSRRWAGLVLVTTLATWAAAMPLLVIQPTYAQPDALLDTTSIPNPVSVRFGEEIALLGYEIKQEMVKPGDRLELSIFWQGLQPITESYVVSIRALDAEGQIVASLDTIPYQGRYPTVTWSPKQAFMDTYRLPPIREEATPGLGLIQVSIFPANRPNEKLPLIVGTVPVEKFLTLARFKLASARQRTFDPAIVVDATFEHKIRLNGYDAPNCIDPSQPFTVTLYWQALSPDGRDYTVFAHLFDESGHLIDQADSPPQEGKYPTSIWAAGEQVVDPHLFNNLSSVSSGTYQVAVGLYELTSGQRLAALKADGNHWPNDSVSLRQIAVCQYGTR